MDEQVPKIVRLRTAQEDRKRKAREQEQPVTRADLSDLLGEVQSLQVEVQELRNTISKLLRLVKGEKVGD